jgi:hypothetical protein
MPEGAFKSTLEQFMMFNIKHTVLYICLCLGLNGMQLSAACCAHASLARASQPMGAAIYCKGSNLQGLLVESVVGYFVLHLSAVWSTRRRYNLWHPVHTQSLSDRHVHEPCNTHAGWCNITAIACLLVAAGSQTIHLFQAVTWDPANAPEPRPTTSCAC